LTADVTIVGALVVNNVRFQLDGANGAIGGGADSTAPYSVSWDTSTVTNGTHTLVAMARSSAGLTFTSDPVTVTVNNNTAPPPPPPSTRFEETDPSVSYTSGWTQGDTSRTWSGGTAALSGAAGSQVSFTFTGPSVTWIGGRSPFTGIASVSVDGVFQRNVDTYSKTEEIRVPMYEAIDLPNTSHTLTIQATGQENPAATGNLIAIDAFDVPASTVSRLQETDPDVSFTTGNWTTGDVSRPWSAGIAALTNKAGAEASFTFSGTGITWIGGKGPQTGMANVFIDGNQVATNLDTYQTAEGIQAPIFTSEPIFTANGLPDSTHTILIHVTGTKNAASSDAIVVVDGFEVTTDGVRHQDTDPAISYGPGWFQDNRDKAYSEGASAESNVTGATATIAFTGTGIRWIGARGPQCGIARISVDGVVAEDLDTYSPTEGPQHADFITRGLPEGPHTLTIEVLGKNPLSSNAWVLIDAYDVIR